VRRFEVISTWQGRGIELPQRKTSASAGYDLEAGERVVLEPGKVTLVPTGLKAYMNQDEVLQLFIRSSLAIKSNLTLANSTAIIDADYVDNPANEGHLLLPLLNRGCEPVIIEKGQRIAQGIFLKYLCTDDDHAEGKRHGGFGSTGI
jgi:dUTP pyrophosphatase